MLDTIATSTSQNESKHTAYLGTIPPISNIQTKCYLKSNIPGPKTQLATLSDSENYNNFGQHSMSARSTIEINENVNIMNVSMIPEDIKEEDTSMFILS